MDDVVSFAVFRLRMSNFSDEEDMRLISLAASYVQLGKRVRWREIAARMTCTNKGVSVLRERLKTLKKTYGTKLDRLPRCLLRSRNLSERVSSARV